MTQVTLEFVSEQLGQLLVEVRRSGERQERQDTDLQALRQEVRTLREQQGRDRQTFQERFAALEAKIDAATGGGNVSLAFSSEQVERVLGDIADLKGDVRIQTATIRRLDLSIESAPDGFGDVAREIRALVERQDRQRQKLNLLQQQLAELERGQPAPA